MRWSYQNPVRVEFGVGTLDRVAPAIAGRPWALVTYGMDLFRDMGARIARAAGPPVVIIDDVAANPDFADLDGTCRRFSAAAATGVIVALGGGSVIDAAKVLAAADGDFAAVRDHLVDGVPLDPARILPILAVPTTAGTGSEVTSWATVWDAAGGRKYSIAHPRLYPEAAIVDPALTLAAPRGLTLATGLDALSHALESLWNVNANPVSAEFAIAAAREVLAVLPRLVDRLDDIELRSRQSHAALLAGLAFSNTKTALAHNISYDVTLRHGTAHGIACSFSLPQVMRWAIGQDGACDARLAAIFGPDLAAGADRLERFLEDLGVPTDPAAHGLDAGEWHRLVDKAFAGERGRNFIGRRALAAE
ncbi:alcohol dehydrogenase [Stella humosa]|uniref:Alcohol dehydrogenase n=1 Tax=Stella humosa TaxID=94 RepID=A0A3N1KYU1_9PROT|nr:iron-containing alcohol dehydrogenase PsrA [Stella humosa]ROP84327.1 alcohol dehydrogenase [Stella humosa]BBK33841.1 methanol dehydrogenase [Stella humosa]